MPSFQDLSLSPEIQKAISDKGYTVPTPIQEKAIPFLLDKKDLLGCAQTGTGKTAAFALPLLQNLIENPRRASPKQARVLILTPTRELAIQIHESFKTYGKYLRFKYAVIFGGVGQSPQVHAVANGVDVLIATPGRLMDLIQQKHLRLSELEVFVLDEADRMLDMGFIHDIKKILPRLPKNKQNIFFSATVSPTIMELAGTILFDPHHVQVTPVSSTAEIVQQHILYIEKEEKRGALKKLIQTKGIDHAIVFTRTKHGADRVARELNKIGVKSEAIHGNKSQNAREKALAGFKNRDLNVLVATDIAARGIDIDQLSHVINFEIPEVAETYVHRIGRTGRAGSAGVSYSFCSKDERPYLKNIQKLIDQQIPVIEL
jgi:ATP-dependent RNA helicase RhlE